LEKSSKEGSGWPGRGPHREPTEVWECEKRKGEMKTEANNGGPQRKSGGGEGGEGGRKTPLGAGSLRKDPRKHAKEP
jgi:hypothetical protein